MFGMKVHNLLTISPAAENTLWWPGHRRHTQVQYVFANFGDICCCWLSTMSWGQFDNRRSSLDSTTYCHISPFRTINQKETGSEKKWGHMLLCVYCIYTHVGSVVVLAGSWSSSGSDADVFSFQQGVDNIIQKGHLDHRWIDILRL